MAGAHPAHDFGVSRLLLLLTLPADASATYAKVWLQAALGRIARA